MYTIKGVVITVSGERSGTSKAGKAWSSIEFTIRHGGDQYPKHASFILFNDKTDLCPMEGEQVEVEFNVDAREWQGKWFNSLNAFKVVSEQAATVSGSQYHEDYLEPITQDKDDLPF